jgi:hypothetical protein
MGISFNPVHQKCMTTIALVFSVFQISVTLYFGMIGFITIDSTVFRVEATVIMLFTVIYSGLVLFIQSQRARWVSFYEIIKKSNQRFLEDNFMDDLDERLKADKGSFLFFLATMNFVFLFPMLNVYAGNVELGSYVTLMFPAKYPWRANTPLTYTMTLTFQMFFNIVCCSVYIGNVAFVYYFRAFLLSVEQMFKKKIMRLIASNFANHQNERIWKEVLSFRRGDDSGQGVKHLLDIVQDHQFFIRY